MSSFKKIASPADAKPHLLLPAHQRQWFDGTAPVVSVGTIVQSNGRVLEELVSGPCNCIAPPCGCESPLVKPIGASAAVSLLRRTGYQASAPRSRPVGTPKKPIGWIPIVGGVVLLSLFARGGK